MSRIKYLVFIWLCMVVCVYSTDLRCLLEHGTCADYVACHQQSDCVSPAYVPDSTPTPVLAAVTLMPALEPVLTPAPELQTPGDLMESTPDRSPPPLWLPSVHLRRGPPVA